MNLKSISCHFHIFGFRGWATIQNNRLVRHAKKRYNYKNKLIYNHIDDKQTSPFCRLVEKFVHYQKGTNQSKMNRSAQFFLANE